MVLDRVARRVLPTAGIREHTVMARRRIKRHGNIHLAKVIVGVVFFLALVFTKQVKYAIQFGLVIVVIGGALVGLAVYFRGNDRPAGFASPNRFSGIGSHPRIALPENPFQHFDQRVPILDNRDTIKSLSWSLELIRSLDWKRLEELCAWYFQAKGRKAKLTCLGADGGADILLYRTTDTDEIFGVVQCKAWTKKPVGVREIRELLGVMTDMGCPLGIFVAIAGYTPKAMAFVEGKHITLIDVERLLGMIQKLPLEAQNVLLQKTTSGDYTTPSCPSCGTKLVLRTSGKDGYERQQFWGCRNFPRCRYTMRQAK